MRKIKIVRVNATSGVPGSIEVAGDFSSIFQGKFYRNAAGATLPFYTTPVPAGYSAIVATTFDIVDNTKYYGRYTVYTPVNGADATSSSYDGTKTTIRVNEVISDLLPNEAATLRTDGSITNISTYLLSTGTGSLVIPPGVDIADRPIEFIGRGTAGWGEAYAQNFINLARNFANSNAPTNPFVGQTWFDMDDAQLRVYDGTTWDLVNRKSYGTTARHTQGTPSTTWTVNHLLNLPAPYIAFVQFFVDRGDGPKVILPSDVTFVSANKLTATFTNPEIGYVLVRQ